MWCSFVRTCGPASASAYVENFGFAARTVIPSVALFCAAAPDGHHDIFAVAPRTSRPETMAFNGARHPRSLFGGGMHIRRCGWDTNWAWSPSHCPRPISGYFKNPGRRPGRVLRRRGTN